MTDARCLTPLFALGFVVIPVASPASCMPGAAPSYRDISGIQFQSAGVTEPIAIHRGVPVEAGLCPVSVDLYVSRSEAGMRGGPACIKMPSGKVKRCCGATDAQTDDPPKVVFDRIVAVLENDRFYSLAEPPQPAASEGRAFYSVTVMRCGAREHHGNVTAEGPPQPGPNASTLTLRIPYGSVPEALYDPDLVKLFDDVTRAVYESEWTTEDIY